MRSILLAILFSSMFVAGATHGSIHRADVVFAR